MKIYTTEQIKKALKLVSQGHTRKEAAKIAKIGVHSLNYYLSKRTTTRRMPKAMLGKQHLRAIQVLKTLL